MPHEIFNGRIEPRYNIDNYVKECKLRIGDFIKIVKQPYEKFRYIYDGPYEVKNVMGKNGRCRATASITLILEILLLYCTTMLYYIEIKKQSIHYTHPTHTSFTRLSHPFIILSVNTTYYTSQFRVEWSIYNIHFSLFLTMRKKNNHNFFDWYKTRHSKFVEKNSLLSSAK